MNWLKENWFKLGILLVIIFLAGYAVYYFSVAGPAKENLKADQEQELNAQQLKTLIEASPTQSQATVTPVVIEKPAPKPAQNLSTNKIKAQLNEFEDYFEGILLDAYINCSVLAAYNYWAPIKDAAFMASALPESKDHYIALCRSTYLSASEQGSKILVAEPPLVELRKKISSFLELVRRLGPIALDGYNQTQAMEDQYKELRTDIREEIIRLRKIY